MDIKAYELEITFLTEVLGSQSTKEVAKEHIARRSGVELAEDEELSLPEQLERGTTVFYKYPNEDTPAIRDYQLKGFLKNAGRVLSGKGGLPKNLSSKVNNLVFISPRWMRVELPEGAEMDYLERPILANTAQGPRVALARSETLPIGTKFKCSIEVFPSEITENVLRELLDYGFYYGLLQWRNGGFGKFRYTLKAVE